MSVYKTLLVDTTNAVTITLPNPSFGSQVILKDTTGLTPTNNITINSSFLIDGYSSTYLASDYISKSYFSDGNTWWSGWFSGAISRVTSSTISTSNSLTYLVDTTSINTITLPTVQTAGQQIFIKDITGLARTNNILITRGAGSYSIDGYAADYNYSVNWGQTCFVSDGSNYFIVPSSVGNIVTVSSNYTISTTSNITLLVDTTSARTIYLPSTMTSGQIITIKDKTGNANTNYITLSRNGLATKIDGVATVAGLSSAWGSKTFLCDGTNYWSL